MEIPIIINGALLFFTILALSINISNAQTTNPAVNYITKETLMKTTGFLASKELGGRLPQCCQVNAVEIFW